MKINRILGIALLVICTGCSRLPLLETIINSELESNSNGKNIFDDFSDDDSGWEEFDYDEGSAGYKDGAYQIVINMPNTDVFSIFHRAFINSEITVKAVYLEGPENNNFGLICRYQDSENFYAGQISSDGFVGIFKVENGEYELLGRDYMLLSNDILAGNAVNEILFECIDKTLILTVNGELADTRRDGTFRSGEVGLIAGNIEGTYGVFQFDDFSVVAR